jgi:hypothetical protein
MYQKEENHRRSTPYSQNAKISAHVCSSPNSVTKGSSVEISRCQGGDLARSVPNDDIEAVGVELLAADNTEEATTAANTVLTVIQHVPSVASEVARIDGVVIRVL